MSARELPIIDRLYISANAQYFHIRKKIPKVSIWNCLTRAAYKPVGRITKMIRQEIMHGTLKFLVSFCVFKTEKRPAFLLSGPEACLYLFFLALRNCVLPPPSLHPILLTVLSCLRRRSGPGPTRIL